MGIKDMIARCMARMRGGACALCDNHQVCPAGRWQGAMRKLTDGDRGGRDGNGLAALLAGVLRVLAGVAEPGSAEECFIQKAEDAIVSLLAKGEVSAVRVAERLGVSRQTLYRRLQAEGTTFEDLLRAKRRQLAIRYLGVGRMPVKVVAWRLGFSDPAAFSRAFKRWTGAAPSRFRAR